MDVVGQADPRDDAVDVIPVANRIGQPLEDEHPRAFADDQAVAAMVERRGPASRRERPELRESHLGVERIGPRHASADHGVGPPGPQLVDGQLEGVERRAAGRVERVGDAPQSQSASATIAAGSPAGNAFNGSARAGRRRWEAQPFFERALPAPRARGPTPSRSAGRCCRTPRRRGGDRPAPSAHRARPGSPTQSARWKTGRAARRPFGSRPVPAGSNRTAVHESASRRVDVIRPGRSADRTPRPGRSASGRAGRRRWRRSHRRTIDQSSLGAVGAREEAPDAHDRDRLAGFRHRDRPASLSSRSTEEGAINWLRRNAWLSEGSTTHSYDVEPGDELATGVEELDVGHGACVARLPDLGHDAHAPIAESGRN